MLSDAIASVGKNLLLHLMVLRDFKGTYLFAKIA
jgi:hypothetical protein